MSEFTIDYILNRAGERYFGTNNSLGIAINHHHHHHNYNDHHHNHNDHHHNNNNHHNDYNNHNNDHHNDHNNHHNDHNDHYHMNFLRQESLNHLGRGITKQLNGGRYSLDEYPMLSWLHCTRYHPPKLPRSLRHAFCKRTRTPGRLPRIPFTSAQLNVLESAYKACNYLSSEEANNLADSLNLTNTRVKIWFQNRRARERREKRATKDDNGDTSSSLNASSPEPNETDDVVEIL